MPEILGKVIISTMKKLISLLIFLFAVFSFSSCIQSVPSLSSPSDETVMLHWLDMDQEGLVRKTMNEGNATNRDSLFSGKAIETFEQSPTKSVSSWRKGERHGVTTEYFYNGRKRRVISYNYGERNGLSKEFRITGELLAEETYSDGKLDGPKSEWHPSGTKVMEVQMRDGKPHGDATEWYLDGTKKSLTIYRHGLREGPSSEWYRTGQQKLGLFYQKDKQHGLRTIWYDNGKKRLTAQFVDDKMEGNSKGWFPNGQQQFDYNFRNNLEHGVCVEWNEAGQKVSELQFIDGQPIQDLLSGRSLKPMNKPTPENLSQESDSQKGAPIPTTDTNEIEKTVILDSEVPSVEIPIIEKDTTKNSEEVKQTNETPVLPTLADAPKLTPVQAESNESNPESTTFDPFNLSPEPAPIKVEVKSDVKEKSVPFPAPPAPTFDPFSDEPNSLDQKGKSQKTVENIAPPPPPTFNPFENKPLEEPTEKTKDTPAINAETAAPAPTFNPFENEPVSESAKMKTENAVAPSDLPPPPPPPVPTFNPFDNDPLPPPPGDIVPQIGKPKDKSNPFDSIESDSNKSSVPLGNIFSSPPEAPPADTFNPFDLPPEN